MIKHDLNILQDDSLLDIGENTEFDFSSAIDEMLITPLKNGKAYHVSIKEFSPLLSSHFLNRYDDFGLPKNLQDGYTNDNEIIFKPHIVSFEFRYDNNFLDKLKNLFEKMSSTRYCYEDIKGCKDLRQFDIPCVVFGDFELEYIQKEGWYGIKSLYLDAFKSIKLEYSRLLAQKLNRFSSNLYFSFIDSNQEHIVGVYSDFRDYNLECYDTEVQRKISRIIMNTKRITFPTYQVEQLGPMALSYKLRSFFLVREKPEENIYTFILFLSDEEISRINDIRTWANAEH